MKISTLLLFSAGVALGYGFALLAMRYAGADLGAGQFGGIAPHLAPGIEASSKAQVRKVASLEVMYCGLYGNVGPTANKKVRQAINYGVNVDTIIKSVMEGDGERREREIRPGHNGPARIANLEGSADDGLRDAASDARGGNPFPCGELDLRSVEQAVARMATGGDDRSGPAGPEELERDIGVENRLAARPVLHEHRHVRTAREHRLGSGEDRHAECSDVFGGAEPPAIGECRPRRSPGEKRGREDEGATQCSIPRMAIG